MQSIQLNLFALHNLKKGNNNVTKERKILLNYLLKQYKPSLKESPPGELDKKIKKQKESIDYIINLINDSQDNIEDNCDDLLGLAKDLSRHCISLKHLIRAR